MRSDRIRMGLIGCGGISRAHRDGFLALSDQVQVAATCDTQLELAEERRIELEADRAYRDYRDILDRKDIDAVDIMLPHDLHKEVTIAAAQAGKHILCEKPIASDETSAREMIEAANNAGVLLMIAYCERYGNAHQEMKRLVESGAVGDPFLLRIDHSQWVHMPAGHWINDPSKLGGGVVAGSGTHRLDLLRWFGGEVRRVAARFLHTGLTPLGGEDTAVISVEFAGGAIGEMVCTWSAQRAPWYETLMVHGSRGVVHNLDGVKISRNGGDFEGVSLSHDDPYGFREEIRHFLSCVRSGETPLTNGNEALKTLRLVNKVYEAANSECWIEVTNE